MAKQHWSTAACRPVSLSKGDNLSFCWTLLKSWGKLIHFRKEIGKPKEVGCFIMAAFAFHPNFPTGNLFYSCPMCTTETIGFNKIVKHLDTTEQHNWMVILSQSISRKWINYSSSMENWPVFEANEQDKLHFVTFLTVDLEVVEQWVKFSVILWCKLMVECLNLHVCGLLGCEWTFVAKVWQRFELIYYR